MKWGNTDAQVQGQAVRAIAAFVAVIPPRSFSSSQLQVVTSLMLLQIPVDYTCEPPVESFKYFSRSSLEVLPIYVLIFLESFISSRLRFLSSLSKCIVFSISRGDIVFFSQV